MDISVDELASALVRTGLYFPSERSEADAEARDIFTVIEEDRR